MPACLKDLVAASVIENFDLAHPSLSAIVRASAMPAE